MNKAVRAAVLGLAALISVAIGAVFPVPPLVLLSRRRRTDRTELALPASPDLALDLHRMRVPARVLDRRLAGDG